MNKSQLIEALSSHFEGNKRSAQHALESVLGTITREVARGEKVAITGFGAFEKAIRPSRMVRNPRTGERTRAKKTAVPKFRAGAHLKDVVSGARKAPKVAPATATKTTSTTGKTAPSKKSAPASKSAATKATTSSAGTKKTAAKNLAKKSSSPATKKSAAKTLAKKSTPASKATAAKSASSTGTKKTAAKNLAKKSSSPATKKSAAKTLAKKSSPAKKTTAKKSSAKKS